MASRILPLLAAILLFVAPPVRADEIRVMTSGGFTAAFLEVVPEFERATGHTIVTAFGASMGNAPDSIPSRLTRGEPADVVIMADTALDDLVRLGRVAAGTRVDLARSSIGMAVRAGARRPDISSVDALKRTLLQASSIAYSASASGVYLSTELFQRLGIADQIKSKTKRIESERVGAVVARGEAEIGFQQISELLSVPGTDYVGPLPRDAQKVTVFSAGLAAGARSPAAARALITFLASPAVLTAITKSGLEPFVSAAGADVVRWWSHVKFLADDRLRGRNTGSEGHRMASEYVVTQFRKAGLEPGGVDGYIQPVAFRSRRIVEEKSSLALVQGGVVTSVRLGDEATFNMRVEHAPAIDAPIVFAGYGLRVPELNHDDLAGLDVRGKVVMLLTGGPATIPGPLLAHYQSVRWSLLKAAGALGTLSIVNPRGMDIPWERSTLARLQPAMTLADGSLDETAGQQIAVTINPARAEKFFTGSGHTFEEVLAAADRGTPLPRFAIPAAVRATVTVATERSESQNVAAILPGTDPVLKNEYVVLSAHLDHLGVGQPILGDTIYNGAMDNASGIATLIETAAVIRETKQTFKRSIVFLAVTAEEKGLLGSRFYAAHPSVPSAAVVANLNTDMFLPLFPLRSVIAQGLDESDLASDLRRAADALGLRVLSDPEPERNAFTRSDQYSFIRRGVPALSLKVGFDRGSPEHAIVTRWRTDRYHAPSDDLAQPIDLQAAAGFNRMYLLVVESVANRPERPRWNAASFFRRFVSSAAPQ